MLSSAHRLRLVQSEIHDVVSKLPFVFYYLESRYLRHDEQRLKLDHSPLHRKMLPEDCT